MSPPTVRIPTPLRDNRPLENALRGLAAGDVLKVVATDPGSVADMAAFSRRTGHEIIQQSEGNGEWVFLIRAR